MKANCPGFESGEPTVDEAVDGADAVDRLEEGTLKSPPSGEALP